MSIWSTKLALYDLHEVDWPEQTERIKGSFVDVATTASPPGWIRLSIGEGNSRPDTEVMLDPDETRQLYLLLRRILGA